MVSVLSDSAESKLPGSILVVDDIEESAKFFAEQLRAYFENVETASPERAERVIEMGKFGALVTDLRFVGNGRFDNGLALAQRLNGHCPPTVILTACVGTKTLSIITGQAVYTDGTPLLRGVMKGSGIEALVAQIRGAMADAERLPEGARAKGIQKVKIPEFNTGEAPAELTNLIALLSEKLKNYVRITRDNLSVLKEKYALEDWPSWKAIKATVEGQLEQFATFNSERLIGKGEKDTLDALHELNSRTILLDMNRLRIPKEEEHEEAVNIIGELRNAHAGIDQEIRGSFKKAENICNPELDFDRDAKRILGRGKSHFEIWYPNRNMEGKTHLRDNGRLITTFLETLHQQFDDKSCSIDIRGIDEEDAWFDGSQEQKKLQKRIDWGGGYRVQLRINHFGDKESKFWGKNYEQLLDPLRGIIEKLIAAKKIYINPEIFSYEMEENGGHIEIILKTKEIDRAALAKKEAEEAKIQVTKIGAMRVDRYGREEVYKVNTPAGELTMIGCSMPKKMKNMGENWCVVLHEGELILSSGRAHFENDIAICHYLVKRKKLSSRDAFHVARESIRLKLQEGTLIADHEQIPEEELKEAREAWKQMGYEGRYENQEQTVTKLEAIAKELGVTGVILDRRSFYGRSGLMYTMVDDLDDPEIQEFRDREGEEKDEWFDVQE